VDDLNADMNARLFSLYWDNINQAMPAAQKAVCDALQTPINQHRIQGFEHGEWIDWVMTRMDDIDVFVFIDIDCIPLSKRRMIENLDKAAAGILVGAEGAANHIDPSRSYAAPWYTYINRKVWDTLGRPSAKSTPYSDIGQNWTDMWRKYRKPVELIPPTHCMTPKWNLPGRKVAHGTGTTYGDDCFHLFEARNKDPKPFLDRCQEILGRNSSVSTFSLTCLQN
jgi:hypothetical protein